MGSGLAPVAAPLQGQAPMAAALACSQLPGSGQ